MAAELGTLCLGYAGVLLAAYAAQQIAPFMTPDEWAQRVGVGAVTVISSWLVLLVTLLTTPLRQDTEELGSVR